MKSIKLIWGILPMLIAISACSKWDSYKDFIAEGETIYSGKLDSIKVFPGNQRVKLTGLLPADPKISKVTIKWNDGNDSISFPISKGSGPEMFSQVFNVAEGLRNFNVQTFDANGNSSVVTSATGVVYGPRYESGLLNRPIITGEFLSNGDAIMNWDVLDTSAGAIGTYMDYTNASNNKVSVFTPINQSVTTLTNYKAGTDFSYRTAYVPKNAIDTFYAAATTPAVKFDLTGLYIKNPGPNFANSDGGNGRWQIPADWIVTDDVKNADGLGGIDNGGWLPSKALSIEAWWGMPPVPNGKIYQAISLTAGRYAFEITTGDCSDGATKYVTVAQGSSLPDIGNVPAQALAYANITKWSTITVNFELSAASQIALGLQSYMPAEGNFLKVFKVKLFKLP